jgi:hypothetical protein
MEHVLDVVYPLFTRYKAREPFPHVIEYRAITLVNNIILYELFCLMLPEQIDYDPLHAMQLLGNGLFTAVIGPCGMSRECWKTVLVYHLYRYRKKTFLDHGKGVYKTYNRLVANLRGYDKSYWYKDIGTVKTWQVPRTDKHLTFEQIWQSEVLPQHKNNLHRCELLRKLLVA